VVVDWWSNLTKDMHDKQCFGQLGGERTVKPLREFSSPVPPFDKGEGTAPPRWDGETVAKGHVLCCS